MDKEIGPRIRKLRVLKGWSIRQLSKETRRFCDNGISPSAISLIENGLRPNPFDGTLEPIAKALKTTKHYLKGEEEPQSNKSLKQQIAELPEPLKSIMEVFITLDEKQQLKFAEQASEIIKKFEVINPKLVDEFLESVKAELSREGDAQA